jgi:hypothetical protein
MVLIWANPSSPTTLLQFLDALVRVEPQSFYHTNYDITTSRMRSLCPKIISGDSRQSKNMQTHHISIQYHDI